MDAATAEQTGMRLALGVIITFIVIGQSSSSGDEGFHCASGATEDSMM
jgi:hypothetical protein